MKFIFGLLCGFWTLSLHAQLATNSSVIVSFKQNLLPEHAKKIIQGLEVKGLKKIHPASKMFQVDIEQGEVEHFISRNEHNPNIEFIEIDQRVSALYSVSDPSFSTQYHHKTIGADIAWDTAQGSGVKIAILDTGVNGSHQDLADNMLAGWNFVANNSNTTDSHNHGTWVAGVSSSVNNNVGGLGVAFKSQIIPVVIADATAYAYFSTMAQGIYYAADNGAKVANLSYHGACLSSSVQSAANYMRSKGGIVVVAAGNQGTYDSTSTNSNSLLCISATDKNDQIASWSEYGNKVDLAAPGVGIYTTSRSGSYSTVNGTSFAAPVVSGVVALMMSANSSLTPAQIDSMLFTTAKDLGAAGWDIYYGQGRVDANRAVAAAIGGSTTEPDPTDPVLDTTAPSIDTYLPANNSVVSGRSVTISATASDNVAVTKMELVLNSKIVASATSGSIRYNWNISKLKAGTYTFTIRAYDTANNTTSTLLALNK